MLDLGLDLLSAIVAATDKGDLLPLALSCKILKNICKHRRKLIVNINPFPNRNPLHRKTYFTDGTSTLGRIKWAVNEMGARHDAKWREIASMTASVPILQWLRDNNFPFSLSTVKYAAQNDHLDVLQWSLQLFVDADGWLPHEFYNIILSRACSYGHLRILKWVQSVNDEFFQEYVGSNTLYLFCHAARDGYLHILEYFDELGFNLYDKYPTSYLPIQYAASGGQIESLKWLKAKNCCPIMINSFRYGTIFGGLAYGGPAYNGDMEVMNWLLENNCVLDSSVCYAAAAGDQLDILMWARAKGCPWDYTVCRKATINGHFHILKWARANGCPWIKRECIDQMRNISTGNNAEMIAWIESQPE